MVVHYANCLTMSISASPTEISTVADYTIDFQPSVAIPTNAKIVIAFPAASYTTIPDGAITGCTAPPFTVTSCTGNDASKSVTFMLTGVSLSFVTLTIPGITNPASTAGVSGYGGTLTNAATNTQLDSLASSGVLFTPTPKSLSAASIGVAAGFDNKVGATLDLVLTVTYASAIEANSVVVIDFPKWERSSDGATSPLS